MGTSHASVLIECPGCKRERLVSARTALPSATPLRPGLTGCKWRVSVGSTRRLEVRMLKSVALVFAIGLAAGGSTALAGATASADVDVTVQKLPGPPAVAGIPFGVDVGIGNAGPDSVSARLLLDLPSGLTATAPNPIGCPVGQGTLDCGPRTWPRVRTPTSSASCGPIRSGATPSSSAPPS
jgi:hypothetical protein